jgi:flagellar hook-length control protein FliK
VSASVSNSSMMLAGFGAPGAATAAGAPNGQKGAAVGAAAGFEALLGAMLGEQQDIAGVAINTGAAGAMPATQKAAKVAAATADDAKAGKDGEADDAATTGADVPAQAQVQPDASLLAGLVILQPAPPAVQTPKIETAATDAAPKAGLPAQAVAAAATPQPPIPNAGTTEVAANDDSEPATSLFAPQTPAMSPPVSAAAAPAPAATAATPQPTSHAKAPDAPQAATPSQAKTDAVASQASPPAAAVAVAQAQAPAQTQVPSPVQAQDAAAAMPAAARAPAAKDDIAKTAASKGEPADAIDAAAKPGKSGSPASAPAAAGAVKHQAADATPDDAVISREAKADTAAPEADTDTAQAAGSSGPAQTAQTHGAQTATAAVRGAPETVAHLAAQIVKKLDGRSTRFDVALDPVGLGHVNVRVEIGAEGRMSAQLAFDNPQAAAELRARANDLHKALEQAGFDLSGGLSFDVASDQGRQNGRGLQQDDNGAAFRGRAFQAVLSANDAADAAAPAYSRRAASGVDVRI